MCENAKRLEKALLCSLKNEPADHCPCKDCYLYPLRDDDDYMPDGTMCSKRLALDAIACIRRLNDFDQSQSKILLEKLEQAKAENAQLRAVVIRSDPDFFKRKCRVCGCDWNHPCNDHDFWVGDDLCSVCFKGIIARSERKREEK